MKRRGFFKVLSGFSLGVSVASAKKAPEMPKLAKLQKPNEYETFRKEILASGDVAYTVRVVPVPHYQVYSSYVPDFKTIVKDL